MISYLKYFYNSIKNIGRKKPDDKSLIHKNDPIRNLVFYKILNDTWTHHGYTYSPGLNIDPIPFNTDYQCCAGGFYFSDLENLYQYANYGTQVAKIIIPNDAKMAFELGKYKADKIIIDSVLSMKDFLRDKSAHYCLEFVNKKPSLYIVIPKKHKESYISSVAVVGNVKMFIHVPKTNKTKELSNLACSINMESFRYVPNKFKDYNLCQKALMNDLKYIQYIPKEHLNIGLYKLAHELYGEEAIQYLPKNEKYMYASKNYMRRNM
jgi:hypothetical protein